MAKVFHRVPIYVKHLKLKTATATAATSTVHVSDEYAVDCWRRLVNEIKLRQNILRLNIVLN